MTHSGHELELMLDRRKAMAAFCRHSSEHFDETGGQDFEQYVNDGKLKRQRFFVKDHKNANIIYTVYFLPGNEWRFNLYKILMKSIEDGWSIDKELIQSALLDYDLDDIVDYIGLLSRIEVSPKDKR